MYEDKLGYRNGQAAWRLWSADGALRTSLGSSGEDPALPIQGAQVRPLLRELDPLLLLEDLTCPNYGPGAAK